MVKKNITVGIEPHGKTWTVPAGTPLKDLLTGYGVEFPCGGKGTCGGCKVRILEGTMQKDPTHVRLLRELDLDDSYGLACKSILRDDVKLEIDQFRHIILSDNTPFDFTPSDGFGVAFDLGTSTLVCQMIDLRNGNVIDMETRMNPQMIHGADLITRMEYALHGNGDETLRTLIRNAFIEMVSGMVHRRSVEVKRIHLVGNTVMHHLFGGLDLTPLSTYPFETPHKSALVYKPAQLGLEMPSEADIVFLPPLGSFVGSDILSGLLAIEVLHRETPLALIDLGTNGEIALAHQERILFASTAAGPAFEGTNISCGMRAASGAISSVRHSDSGFHFQTIGNVPAKGICGSGLIDLVAGLLEAGMMDPGGRFTMASQRIHLKDNVFATQKDIREFQLAKGAIATGLEILSNHIGLEPQDLKKIYIAGAFGNFINLENTRKIGLLNVPEDKIHRMGNSALLGAKMSLFNKEDDVAQILERSEHVSLESHPDFMDVFSRNIVFGNL